MMDFLITATRGRTKEKVELIIRAEDAAQAERVARLYGLAKIRAAPADGSRHRGGSIVAPGPVDVVRADHLTAPPRPQSGVVKAITQRDQPRAKTIDVPKEGRRIRGAPTSKTEI